jgi:hypothetical protein
VNTANGMNPRTLARDGALNHRDRAWLARPKRVLRVEDDTRPPAASADPCPRCGARGVHGCEHQAPFVRPDPVSRADAPRRPKMFTRGDLAADEGLHERTRGLLFRVDRLLDANPDLRVMTIGREAVGHEALLSYLRIGFVLTAAGADGLEAYLDAAGS